MQGFSGAVKLTGLDDFISPGQECIKPVEILKKKQDKLSKRLVIEMEDDGAMVEVSGDGERVALEKTTIDLNDCLACSGCITSAESILISQQSGAEFLKQVSAGDKTVVVSIAPQARTSLAHHFHMDQHLTHCKLIALFKQLGAHHVIDSSYGRVFTQMETRKEFLASYATQIESQAPQEQVPQPESGVCPPRLPSSKFVKQPLLNSSCPGWICYAEKTHGDTMLPLISAVRSPQQIMGSLVKGHLAARLGKSAGQLYHVSIMPCFDKKLEASRDDFFSEQHQTRDVDTVLTPGEILSMLESQAIDFVSLPAAPIEGIDKEYTLLHPETGELAGGSGGSGGYAEDLYKHCARHVWGVQVDQVPWKQGRNPDFKEARLEIQGVVVLSVALAYGFRHIQNIVRKVKSGRNVHHYVEIMACPSGCLNGGGQVKPPSSSTSQQRKQLVRDLDKLYHTLPVVDPCSMESVKTLYDGWVGSPPGGEAARLKLHTQYHAVAKLSSNLGITWCM